MLVFLGSHVERFIMEVALVPQEEKQYQLSASHSEIETFTSCERKHYYSYGLKIHGKTMSDKLIVGIMGHACLAAYYQARQDGIGHDDALDILIDEFYKQKASYTHEIFDGDKWFNFLFDALTKYFDHYGDEVKDAGWEVLRVETRYDVRLTDTFTIPIVLDLLVRIPGYGIVLLDHKFTWNFYNVDQIDLSPQLPRYYVALSELGWKINGIWYNEIRTQVTKANKDNPAELFSRVPITLNANKSVTIMREHLMAAERIGKLRQLPGGIEEWEQSIIRNTSACNMCGFKTICAADLDGNDSEIILRNFYEEKKSR